jgi:protein-S-isoprenylcysteine O-methyltransferase Ste14
MLLSRKRKFLSTGFLLMYCKKSFTLSTSIDKMMELPIMIKFDPLGWFEHIIPMRWLYRIIRVCALAAVTWFLVVRISQYNYFFCKPLWAAETLLFIVLVIAFIVRSNPVDRSQGIKEIVIPLIGSVLPFGLLRTYPSTWMVGNISLLTTIFLWMTFSTGFTVWGMWALRHSFSITVEARRLVTSGPYRWVRHPVYLGEILTAAAVTVWRWSWQNVAILLIFVTIQLVRACMEESKLVKVFPGYRDSLGRSMWFWKMG